MKERLRELAEQAGRGQERWNTTAQFESFLEKFAELIVLECCKEITQEPFNAGAASLWLKDYFGLEEAAERSVTLEEKQWKN